MKLKPLHDRVIVKPFSPEEATESGLIIPETARVQSQQGRVVAVGPGLRNKMGRLIPVKVKEGDVILYGKYAGVTISYDGEDWLIMREGDIYGIAGEVKDGA